MIKFSLLIPKPLVAQHEYIQKWTGTIGALANLVEIKACEKFYRRHVVDIPRIRFFA